MRVSDIMYKTPILVNTQGSFPDYISSLSRKAKKNFKTTMKLNQTTFYCEVGFDPALMEQFMALWEKQLIRGEHRRWAFDVTFLANLSQKNILKCFVAAIDDKPIAAHFIEVYNGYVECHPPMYSKQKYSKQYMAKFMWFKLIEWAHDEPDIDWLDLGGGYRGTWPELIKNRNEHPNTTYKWMYVPENVKNNPERQPSYVVSPDKKLYEK